jgi:hypothetical protein
MDSSGLLRPSSKSLKVFSYLPEINLIPEKNFGYWFLFSAILCNPTVSAQDFHWRIARLVWNQLKYALNIVR